MTKTKDEKDFKYVEMSACHAGYSSCTKESEGFHVIRTPGFAAAKGVIDEDEDHILLDPSGKYFLTSSIWGNNSCVVKSKPAAAEGTGAPEETGAPEGTGMPKATGAPEGTGAPKETGAPEESREPSDATTESDADAPKVAQSITTDVPAMCKYAVRNLRVIPKVGKSADDVFSDSSACKMILTH